MSRVVSFGPTNVLLFCLLGLIEPALLRGDPPAAGAEAAPAASAVLAKEVRRATEREAGLCVLAGCDDGALAAELTNAGRMVVHCLTLDPKAVEPARKVIRDRGLYGLASVELTAGLNPLPYADNLVNVLVADLDTLGDKAPSREEIRRVLAPLGAAHVKSKGTWTKIFKPMPKGMDGWTHFYHGPNGNPVSEDEEVGPPTGLQWLAGVTTMGAEPTTGFRLAGGRAVYEWEGPRPDRRAPAPSFLVCRDAFSGVVLWSKATSVRPHKTRPIVMTAERVYTYLEAGGPLVALDAQTGDLVRTYEQGGRPDKKLSGNRSDVNLVFHEGLLVQTAGNTAYVLNAASGDLMWKHSEPEGRFVDYPTIAAATGQVFFTTGLTSRDTGRYPGADTRHVLAFDLKTGKSQWRCDMGRELSQLCFVDGSLYAFNLAGFIGRLRDLFLARIRPTDGSVLWKINPGPKGQFLDFSIVDGKIYVMSLGLKIYAADSGKEIASLPMPGNSRCEMSRATKNYLLMSFGNFIDLATDPLELQRCEITRGSCGTGNTPGYGMLYYNPNRCQCFVSVRGYLAVSREPFRAPIADELRLEQTEARKRAPDARIWPAADEWPIYLGNPQRSSSTPAALPQDLKPAWKASLAPVPGQDAGPVPTDVFQSSHFNGPVTAPVIATDKVFVAVPEAHRVEALDAKTGKKAWNYTAGGRVDTPPTIHDGLCLFGCRDGHAYALDAASGKLCGASLPPPTNAGWSPTTRWSRLGRSSAR